MVQRCCCCGTKYCAGGEITLHRFPLRNPVKLQQWLQRANLNADKINVHSKICSEHFEKKHFTIGSNKKMLTEMAVPTLFNTCNLPVCLYCSAKKSDNKKRSFHKFPVAKRTVLEKWIASAPVFQSLEISKRSVICSDHFEPTCFKQRGDLKPNAVPTIFHQVYQRQERSKLRDEQLQETSACSEDNDVSKQLQVYPIEHVDMDGIESATVNIQKNDTATVQPCRCQILSQHNYTETLDTTKTKLLKTKLSLAQKTKEYKVQKQQIKRMHAKITILKDIVRQLNRKMIVTETELATLKKKYCNENEK